MVVTKTNSMNRSLGTLCRCARDGLLEQTCGHSLSASKFGGLILCSLLSPHKLPLDVSPDQVVKALSRLKRPGVMNCCCTQLALQSPTRTSHALWCSQLADSSTNFQNPDVPRMVCWNNLWTDTLWNCEVCSPQTNSHWMCS